MLIADSGGVAPLVALLKSYSNPGAQETAAGALSALADSEDNRVRIAEAGGIKLLIILFENGPGEAMDEVQCALQTLVKGSVQNQLTVVTEAVAMLRNGSSQAQEHVTELLRNLSLDPDNRSAIAKAGAVPELVKQLECGSDKAMGLA